MNGISSIKKLSRRLALCAALAAALSTVVQAQELPPRIKFGMLFSMTGPAASSNAGLVIAARLAIKEINEKGGVLGRPIDMVAGDDASDPTQAVTEARRLVEREKVHIMVGPGTTQSALAVMPVYNQSKMASVVNSASSAFTPQVAPYAFADYFSSEGYAKAMVDYLADVVKAKKVAIIADTSGQSKGVVADYKKYLALRGIAVSGEADHPFGTNDVIAQVLALRRTNPDALIQQTGNGEDAGLTLKTMEELGWKLPVVSSIATVLQSTVVKVAGPDVFKSGRIVGLTFKAFSYCPGEPVGRSDFARFLQRLKAFEPDNFDKLNIYAMSFMYDAVNVLKAAIEGTRSVYGPAIANWIVQNAPNVPAVSGKFSPTKTSNFLFGSESVYLVPRPDVRREDGLMQRAGC